MDIRYKINNPTILARVSHKEIEDLFKGYGYTPYFVEGSDPETMHQAIAATLEHCILKIRAIQEEVRRTGIAKRPRWPMIVLRSPKGWTCPAEIDGHKVEGSWRAHQVPIASVADNPAHLEVLEKWMRSYHPEEHFDKDGKLRPELQQLAPAGNRRMSANPVANGGSVRKALHLPDFREYGVDVKKPGELEVENTKPLSQFLAEVLRQNPNNFRVFGPDETTSNKPMPFMRRVPNAGWLSFSRKIGTEAISRLMAG